MRRHLPDLLWCGAMLACVAVAACDVTSSKTDENMRKAVDNIRYVTDTKTGLCFAMLSSYTYYSHQVTSITAVPCDRMPR